MVVLKSFVLGFVIGMITIEKKEKKRRLKVKRNGS